MAVTKIISGGQTGADQGGLAAAKRLGLETGGWIPRGWRTETGSRPDLATFGLKQFPHFGYPARTQQNVRDSDGTVIFGNIDEPGSNLTRRLCDQFDKPSLHVDPVLPKPWRKILRSWVRKHNICILNIAGNRESVHPGIQRWVEDFIVKALHA